MSGSQTSADALQPPLDESGYLGLWRERGLHSRPPADSAYEGGLLADRPAWVFVAGYQAAIRAVFPELETEGWVAFAVTEDRADPVKHPPLTAKPEESEWLLSGVKTWVAQSQNLSDLIVTARLRERTELFRVSADIKGLTIQHRQAPAFLAALSQGYAHFDESPAARLDAPARRKQFGLVEAVAMMIATAGYLQRNSAEDAAAQAAVVRLRGHVGALGDMLAKPESIDPIRLREIDQQFHEAFANWQAAAATEKLPDFEQDKRLFSLYRGTIAKAAERALIKVSEPNEAAPPGS